jgi:hypothetical protein
MSSNTITCEYCDQIIDLDNTDWCVTCDRSIFDDRSDLSSFERRQILLARMIKLSEKIGEYDTDAEINVWLKMVDNGFTSCAGARKFVIENRVTLKKFLDLFKEEDGVV